MHRIKHLYSTDDLLDRAAAVVDCSSSGQIFLIMA